MRSHEKREYQFLYFLIEQISYYNKKVPLIKKRFIVHKYYFSV